MTGRAAGEPRAGGRDGSAWVGRPVLRREDEAILRGRGTYVDSMRLPGMVHLVAVRSPVAHAALAALDTAEAAAAPGVVAVLTGADLAGAAGTMPVNPMPVNPMPVNPFPGAEVADVPIPLLASGRVRFAGEPVAVVAAESRAAAEDAAELVAADYDPLPVLVDPHEALGAEVRLHDAVDGNVLLRWRRTTGDVDGAFRSAARVARGRFGMPRLVASPIEPRGAVADYDPGADLLTMWLSAQDPYRPLRNLAAVLGRPPERCRVVVRDVGGAFGSKGPLAPEAALAALVSIRLGRPVKWIEDRSENFLASYQGRGQEIEAELALRADGRFLALRARVLADLGAYLYPSTAVPPINAAMLATGCYDIPAADVEVVGVATNKVPTGPYRGAGRPEGAYVVERLADLAARQVGADPVAIRHLNFVPPEAFPYTSAGGLTYDSGDYGAALDRACELLGYDARREEQRAARAAGRLVGIGVCAFIERAGAGDWETGTVTVGADGGVVVRTGSTAHGQGHQTTFAQIAAEPLGLAPGDVTVQAGDTSVVPQGIGTFGSRSVTVGGSAIHLAARQVAAEARRVAASLLGVDPGDVHVAEGGLLRARDGSGGRSVTLAEVAAAASGLEARARFESPGPVFPFGAYAAVVEIDPDTGGMTVRRLVGVDDGGRIVNPLLAEGQVVGSTVQGIGQAMYEEAVYDAAGQLLTGNFASYGIPTAVEAPEMVSELRETPSPRNPLGAKGLGESGTIAVPALLANAVADALAPLGVGHVDPPYRPETLWRIVAGRS